MLHVRSQAFGPSEPIPRDFTGDGRDLSPPLVWSDAPPDARSFALVCQDPDAPRADPFVHWLVYDIPGHVHLLPPGVDPIARPSTPAGIVQGKNSFGALGYRGPAPPRGHGLHHYHFHLYALDADLGLDPGLDRDALLRAMDGHVVAEAEVVGLYERR